MTTRRVFLQDLGWTTTGILVFGAACANEPTNDAPATSTTDPAPSTTVDPTADPTTTTSRSSTSVVADLELTWERVNLGFVSAYLLSRSGEIAVVDTGVEGSESAIESGLAAIGAGWSDVAHVILTHRHGDHVGSLPVILGLATEATAHAGAADIPAIESPRPIQAVADGDLVFGMQIIATPGHTEGHIAVLDPTAGLLVAGDALNGSDGGVAGPNPQFTPDMDLALESVRKLSQFEFDTVVFGHGEPVIEGAAEAVRALVASS